MCTFLLYIRAMLKKKLQIVKKDILLMQLEIYKPIVKLHVPH